MPDYTPPRPKEHNHELLSNRLLDRADEAQKLIWDLEEEFSDPAIRRAIGEAKDLLRTLTNAAKAAKEGEEGR